METIKELYVLYPWRMGFYTFVIYFDLFIGVLLVWGMIKKNHKERK